MRGRDGLNSQRKERDSRRLVRQCSLPMQLYTDWKRLHVGNPPTVLSPEHLEPISNNKRKPAGGLWTSTYHPHTGSSFIQFLKTRPVARGARFHCWLLRPLATARVATIDCYADLMRLGSRFGWHRATYSDDPPREVVHRLDFVALAPDGRAVHLTQRGCIGTSARSRRYHLGNWMVESTVWFRWVFAVVDDLGEREFH